MPEVTLIVRMSASKQKFSCSYGDFEEVMKQSTLPPCSLKWIVGSAWVMSDLFYDRDEFFVKLEWAEEGGPLSPKEVADSFWKNLSRHVSEMVKCPLEDFERENICLQVYQKIGEAS